MTSTGALSVGMTFAQSSAGLVLGIWEGSDMENCRVLTALPRHHFDRHHIATLSNEDVIYICVSTVPYLCMVTKDMFS